MCVCCVVVYICMYASVCGPATCLVSMSTFPLSVYCSVGSTQYAAIFRNIAWNGNWEWSWKGKGKGRGNGCRHRHGHRSMPNPLDLAKTKCIVPAPWPHYNKAGLKSSQHRITTKTATTTATTKAIFGVGPSGRTLYFHVSQFVCILNKQELKNQHLQEQQQQQLLLSLQALHQYCRKKIARIRIRVAKLVHVHVSSTPYFPYSKCVNVTSPHKSKKIFRKATVEQTRLWETLCIESCY